MNKRGIIVIVIGVLIILSILFFIFNTKDCKTSGCFEKAALKCNKATIKVQEANGSISQYTIKGDKGSNCLLHIELKKMSSLSQEMKDKFEGKDMLCQIPKNEFSRMKIEEMGSNLDYCHGPLKEEIYDVVIKKLYNLVIRDMGSVLQEVERVL